MNNAYRELGFTQKEAQDRTDAMITSMTPVVKKTGEVSAAAVLAADALGKSGDATEKLSKSEMKAALAARKLASGFQEIKDTGLGVYFGKARKEIKKLLDELEPDKPPKMELLVNPYLTMDEIDSKAPTANMIELGNDLSKALADSLDAGLAGAAVGIGETLGNAIGGGDFDMGGVLIGAFSSLLATFGQQMIVLGIAQAALFESLKLGPLGAAVAIGGGIALIAAASAIKSSMSEGATGFAAGGLVTGSVFANVGEGRGTTKSNPEVIAPLDKLQNMIAGSGGGMGGGEVVFRIQGQELVGILNRQQKVNKFS